MNWKRSLPSGTRDKLFREASGSHKLEQKVCTVLENRGYQRVETPILEFEDVFKMETIAGANLYRFFDYKNRVLALRPDMTLPIGRVVATTGVTLPLQMYYSGKIFRLNDEMVGEQNQQTQAGIEILGYDSLKAELECITCAYAVLKELKIPNYHIEMGHAAIYKEILRVLNLNEKDQGIFEIHVLNKSITSLAEFVEAHPSSLDEFICALPRLFGEVEETVKYARQLTDNPMILNALDELIEIKTSIHKFKKELPVTIDLGIVPTMSYYSGVIFRGFADEAPDYFFSGGRYDHLLEQFGNQKIPAVGLAFNVDRLVDIQYEMKTFPKLATPKTLIFYELSQLNAAQKLLAETENSRLSLFDQLEEAIQYGEIWGYDCVIALTGDGEKTYHLKEGLER